MYYVIYEVPENACAEVFSCEADDPSHAVEQCQDAYPDAKIDITFRVIDFGTKENENVCDY